MSAARTVFFDMSSSSFKRMICFCSTPNALNIYQQLIRYMRGPEQMKQKCWNLCNL